MAGDDGSGQQSGAGECGMRQVIRAAILVLVWLVAILEIAFFVGVGVACQGC